MPPAAAEALAGVMRADRGRLLAALIARTGDFQRAEDALHEAAAAALVHWARAGVPARPEGWLLRAALRKAIDGFRRERTAARHAEAMLQLSRDEAALADAPAIPDDRLRLIFTCCHPALDRKSRVALTLRSLCGLTTAEVARAFLDSETAMGQRLSRARAKIAAARIPFALPEAADLPARLDSVLTVIYLIFTTGYRSGPLAGHDVCEEAIFLARLIPGLGLAAPEAAGCLALLLITHARRDARVDATHATVALADQDRGRWDHAAIAEGRAILARALGQGAPGPFQIKAAIAACHSGPQVDWREVLSLYDILARMEPSPVVRLNRAVALAETGAVAAALDELDGIGPALGDYRPFHAARAAILGRAGHVEAAARTYDLAIALAASAADAAFLTLRRDALRN